MLNKSIPNKKILEQFIVYCLDSSTNSRIDFFVLPQNRKKYSLIVSYYIR